VAVSNLAVPMVVVCQSVAVSMFVVSFSMQNLTFAVILTPNTATIARYLHMKLVQVLCHAWQWQWQWRWQWQSDAAVAQARNGDVVWIGLLWGARGWDLLPSATATVFFFFFFFLVSKGHIHCHVFFFLVFGFLLTNPYFKTFCICKIV
jgi:hypothetical protein